MNWWKKLLGRGTRDLPPQPLGFHHGRRTLSRHRLDRDEWLVWNEFTRHVAMSEPEGLEPMMRPAFLVFWYDGEVANGGHGQYFANRGTAEAPLTLKALDTIGAPHAARVLERALEIASALDWSIEDAPALVERAASPSLVALDRDYGALVPRVTDLLQKHVEANVDVFFVVDETR